MGSLTPRRAHTVVGLWRRYAAARYSTELMAGRATRLVKELTRELVDTRGEACEVQRHQEVQLHHLNHMVGRGLWAGQGACARCARQPQLQYTLPPVLPVPLFPAVKWILAVA